jgi:hypothetical protein
MVLPPDAIYAAARRVLLDALEALEEHRDALIVAGAQAVYLRTATIASSGAPYTTDGDLVIDPSLLGPVPRLADAMRGASFELSEPTPGKPEPGIWQQTLTLDDTEIIVPVDLIVPEGAAPAAGRRGARLPPHGKLAARKIGGLEVALYDHSRIEVGALQANDARAFTVNVAAIPALMIAKAHKLGDRVIGEREHRLNDKDAGDVFRMMQASNPTEVADRLLELREHEIAAAAIQVGIERLGTLFTSRGTGTDMAVRALELDVPAERVRTVASTYTERLVARVSG